MSAEAVRAVIENSRVKGPHLLMLIMIADESKDRHSGYFRAEVGFDVLAKKCRLCLRRAKEVVAELVAGKRLYLIISGGGSTANLYEIPVRKSYRVPVQKPAPVYREEPYTHPSRADSRCEETPSAQAVPANIIPITYPKPKRKAKA